MPAPIVLGDIEIHRIVEQQGPFFEAAQFFPTLTAEMMEPHRSWLTPSRLLKFSPADKRRRT